MGIERDLGSGGITDDVGPLPVRRRRLRDRQDTVRLPQHRGHAITALVTLWRRLRRSRETSYRKGGHRLRQETGVTGPWVPGREARLLCPARQRSKQVAS